MKKTIVALTLLGMTSSAYATKARLLALGQDKDDNYFVEDNRSIFYNAAYINNFADTMTMEWGGSGTAGSELDTNNKPKAMGGFLKSSGNYIWGVHLGNESNTGALLRYSAESTATALPKADNVFDVFFGSEMGGMKWGANVLYTSYENETGTPSTSKEESNMAVRLGVIRDNIEGFANISLKGESKIKDDSQKFDGSLGLHLGGAYNMGEHRFIGAYKQLKWDIKNAKHTTAVEAKYNRIEVGYGNTKDLGNGASVYTQVLYRTTKVEAPFTVTNTPAEMTHMVLPLTVGFEVKANDWLTWRGSVSHNLTSNVKEKGIDDVTTGVDNFTDTFVQLMQAEFGVTGNTGTTTAKKTLPNKTAVTAGASLNFGKLSVDGMIGTVNTATGARDSDGTKGILSLDNLLSRVGVNYAF